MKTKKAKEPEDLRIEYRPLSQFERALRNPKGHSIPEIQASMRRFGFVEPGVLNEATGRLVAGHGRAEALDLMKAAGEKPPGRIREKGGEWLVPVLRGVSFASDADAEAYLVASGFAHQFALAQQFGRLPNNSVNAASPSVARH